MLDTDSLSYFCPMWLVSSVWNLSFATWTRLSNIYMQSLFIVRSIASCAAKTVTEYCISCLNSRLSGFSLKYSTTICQPCHRVGVRLSRTSTCAVSYVRSSSYHITDYCCCQQNSWWTTISWGEISDAKILCYETLAFRPHIWFNHPGMWRKNQSCILPAPCTRL